MDPLFRDKTIVWYQLPYLGYRTTGISHKKRVPGYPPNTLSVYS
jgi:hypothetical protein